MFKPPGTGSNWVPVQLTVWGGFTTGLYNSSTQSVSATNPNIDVTPEFGVDSEPEWNQVWTPFAQFH